MYTDNNGCQQCDDDDTGNRRGEDNAVNAEFQYKYDNEEVRQHEMTPRQADLTANPKTNEIEHISHRISPSCRG